MGKLKMAPPDLNISGWQAAIISMMTCGSDFHSWIFYTKIFKIKAVHYKQNSINVNSTNQFVLGCAFLPSKQQLWHVKVARLVSHIISLIVWYLIPSQFVENRWNMFFFLRGAFCWAYFQRRSAASFRECRWKKQITKWRKDLSENLRS